MNRLLPPAVIAAAAAALAGCASIAPGTQPPPAVPSVSPAFQKDITAMTAYCTQNPAQLSAMVAKVHQLEVSDGITDETMTQLAGHLLTVVSAYKSRCRAPTRLPRT